MDEQTSKKFFEDGIAKLRNIADVMGMTASDIVVDGNVVYVSLPCRKDGKRYCLQVKYEKDYPEEPLDCLFVDPITHQESGPGVWPDDGSNAFKRGENPPWICMAGTKSWKTRHGDPIDPSCRLMNRLVFSIYSQMNK
jgi:hypothetical protein